MNSPSRQWILLMCAGALLAGCAAPATAVVREATGTAAPPTAAPSPTAPAPTDTAPPPSATTAPSPVPATETIAPPTAVPVTAGPDLGYVPNGQSVWEVPSTPDNMTGSCTSGPLSVPYGRIALTPSGNSLEFRDQGVGTYTFYQAGKNVYTYNGRSNLVAGNLTMTLTFTGAQIWTMHAVTVLDADPQCQHNHDYAAVFKWVR